MTIFFENIRTGKVLPFEESEDGKEKQGRPPEEILPSLRKGFVEKKLQEIQRKAKLDFKAARPHKIHVQGPVTSS